MAKQKCLGRDEEKMEPYALVIEILRAVGLTLPVSSLWQMLEEGSICLS